MAARHELKAFHFNGILKSKCLATQKTFSCVFVLFVVSKTPEPLRVSVLFILRVSPKAQAPAFKSFHSLLSPNTEYGGKKEKCKQ